MSMLQVVNQKAIMDVSERLRDTKRIVRRDAAMHLMAVFRYQCPLLTPHSDSSIP